jgi:ParB family chromosome partitioning protein
MAHNNSDPSTVSPVDEARNDQLGSSIASENNVSANADQAQVDVLFIDGIIVPESHRAVVPAAVDRLAESMKRVGLLSPILVRSSEKEGEPATLIAGRHRLEAAKKLGWGSINGYCLYVSEAEARMRQITENLHRSDLTKLERAEQIEEWRVLCEEQAKVTQLASPGGKQKKERGTRKAAKALGVSQKDVQRAGKIAKITPAAKKAAKDAGIDDNQSKLLKVAAADPEKQAATVRQLAEHVARRQPVRKTTGKLTPRQRKIARNKARREREIEESRRRAEERKAFEEKVRRWVQTLSAEQARGLQELVDEWGDDESFVLIRGLRDGIEINLTGVDAKCWRVQCVKDGKRFGNVLYFDWRDAQRFAARLEEAPGIRTVLVPVLESDEVRSAAVPNSMMRLEPGEDKPEPLIVHPCFADDTWTEETEGGHEAYTVAKAKNGETCSVTPSGNDIDAEASAEAMKARFAAEEVAS